MQVNVLFQQPPFMTLPIWAAQNTSGTADVFTHIALAHMDDVYNFSRWMLGDEEDAKDITSETFLSLYKHLATLDTGRPIKPWLIKVARNKALDLIKKKKNIAFSELPDEVFDVPDNEPSIEAKFQSQEFLESVRKIMDEFAPEVREVLLLKYFEGFTFSEIAETMGVPENTAKSHFYRAQSYLYKKVKEII